MKQIVWFAHYAWFRIEALRGNFIDQHHYAKHYADLAVRKRLV